MNLETLAAKLSRWKENGGEGIWIIRPSSAVTKLHAELRASIINPLARGPSDDEGGVLFLVLSSIDPGFWQERYRRPPRELLRSLQENAWHQTAIIGLVWAAIRFRNGLWLVPLWDFLDKIDRGEPNPGAQPAAQFRLLMHNIAKQLPKKAFDSRIAADANSVESFSYERFQDRWDKIYREWPFAATRAIMQRLSTLPNLEYKKLSKRETTSIWQMFELLAESAAPSTFEEILGTHLWPPHFRRQYKGGWSDQWAKAKDIIRLRKSKSK